MVYAMEEVGTDTGMLLAFQFRNTLEFVFLDKDLHFSRKISTDYRPALLEEILVDGILNTPDEVYVFMPSGEAGDIVSTSLLKINKQDGSHLLLPLYFDPEMKTAINKGNVKNFKTFQFDNRFYKLWIDLKNDDLYVVYFELGESKSQNFKKINLPIEGIGKRLGKRQVIPTPLITGDHDVSLISNAKQEKIYLFPSEMIISAENPETGHTELIAINTDTWELSVETYPFAGFQRGITLQINSFIYDGFLFQGIFSKQQGLQLNQVSFETGDILHEKRWETAEAFDDDFPLRRQRKQRGGTVKIKENPDLWRRFASSLSIVLHPEGQKDRLIIGAHTYMDQQSRDILTAVSIAGGMASTLGVGFTVGNSLYIDPFEPMNYLIDASFYFGEGQVVQGDTYLDLESFELLHEHVDDAEWDKTMAAIFALQTQHKLNSMSLFEYKGKMYVGFWEKRIYYLYHK